MSQKISYDEDTGTYNFELTHAELQLITALTARIRLGGYHGNDEYTLAALSICSSIDDFDNSIIDSSLDDIDINITLENESSLPIATIYGNADMVIEVSSCL